MNRDGKVQLFLAVIAIFLIALAVGLAATNLSAAQVSFLRGSVTSLSGDQATLQVYTQQADGTWVANGTSISFNNACNAHVSDMTEVVRMSNGMWSNSIVC